LRHTVWPLLPWYFPLGHNAQLGTALDPPLLYVPALQLVHVDAPAADSVPAAQTEQVELPAKL
jgi:hypothetical protein